MLQIYRCKYTAPRRSICRSVDIYIYILLPVLLFFSCWFVALVVQSRLPHANAQPGTLESTSCSHTNLAKSTLAQAKTTLQRRDQHEHRNLNSVCEYSAHKPLLHGTTRSMHRCIKYVLTRWIGACTHTRQHKKCGGNQNPGALEESEKGKRRGEGQSCDEK